MINDLAMALAMVCGFLLFFIMKISIMIYEILMERKWK